MQLQAIQPRQDWIKTNEQLRFASGGLTARPDTWDEGRVWSDHLCVAISETQAAILHEATQRIHDLCMDTVDGIVKSGDYPTQFGFSDAAIRLIETSWKRGDPLLTGRLDLAFDGVHAPKLLEYNSDNAGLLLETAVLQSQWAHDKQVSQYNSVYRGLVAAWQAAQEKIGPERAVHFATDFSVTDAGFVADTHKMAAGEAGVRCDAVDIRSIGWDDGQRKFFDPSSDANIDVMLKVYNWHSLLDDAYGAHIVSPDEPVLVLEPAYTMLLQNKAFLATLSEKHPGHDNLLLTRHADTVSGMAEFASRPLVRKPLNGSNGAGVEIKPLGAQYERPLAGHIYQEYRRLPLQHGHSMLTQSWLTGGKSAGASFMIQRGDMVKGDEARVVPHYVHA